MKIQEQCKEIQSQLLTSIRILRSSNSSSTTVIQGFANSMNLVKEFSGGETNSLRPSKKGTKVLDSKIKSIQGEIFDNSPVSDSHKLLFLKQMMEVIAQRKTYAGSMRKMNPT